MIKKIKREKKRDKKLCTVEDVFTYGKIVWSAKFDGCGSYK
jgi:hypothetical protein